MRTRLGCIVMMGAACALGPLSPVMAQAMLASGTPAAASTAPASPNGIAPPVVNGLPQAPTPQPVTDAPPASAPAQDTRTTIDASTLGEDDNASVSTASGPVSIDGTLRRGRDFSLVEHPVFTTPGQVEVVVFRWYGSPWTAQAAPLLRRWLAEGQSGVSLRLAPAVMDDTWGYGARIFYALESLGLPQSIHLDLAEAVARHEVDYNNPSSVLAWVRRQGIADDDFRQAINSNLVVAEAASAPAITKTYGVLTVPTAVVAGRYILAPDGQHTTAEQALAKAHYMVDQMVSARATH